METLSQGTKEDWVFTNLQPNAEYTIQVSAPGFESSTQFVNLPNMDQASAHVEFFLVRARGGDARANPPGGAILAPRAQREVQKGIRDLEANNVDSAQKHLATALKMAPGNPEVNYLAGVGWLHAGNMDQAVWYLKNAISLDPKAPQPLLELGMVRYKQGNLGEAISLAKQALESAPKFWQAHWLLADALLRKGVYDQASDHAKSALKYGKKKAEQAELVLAVSLAKLGKKSKSLKIITDYLKHHPNDVRAEHVRDLIAKAK